VNATKQESFNWKLAFLTTDLPPLWVIYVSTDFRLKGWEMSVIDGPNIERTNFYFLPDHVNLRI